MELTSFNKHEISTKSVINRFMLHNYNFSNGTEGAEVVQHTGFKIGSMFTFKYGDQKLEVNISCSLCSNVSDLNLRTQSEI